MLHRWKVLRWPNDARILATLPIRSISFGLMITHLRRGDTHS
jgi:hypothetical protein